MESKIVETIKKYQYTKAKVLIVSFFKEILTTLLAQTGNTRAVTEIDCINSLIFSLLQPNTTHACNKSACNNLEQFEIGEFALAQYKHLLVFFSENLCTFLGCSKLVFLNENELDQFISDKKEIMDIILACKLDEKIKILEEIYVYLKKIESDLTPMQIFNIFNDIIKKTKSESLKRLALEIDKIVNIYGGDSFNWKNLEKLETMEIEDQPNKSDKSTMTEKSLITTKMDKETMTMIDEKSVQEGSKEIFTNILFELLNVEDIEFSQYQNYHSIESLLNSYVRNRLRKNVSMNSDVSEGDLKHIYTKYIEYEKFLQDLSELLQTDKCLGSIFTHIRSIHTITDRLFKMYNISNDYDLLAEIEYQKNTVSQLSANKLDATRVLESVNTLTRLNNNCTINTLVKDFENLHSQFLNKDFGVIFSLENVIKVLIELKTKADKADKVQLKFQPKKIETDVAEKVNKQQIEKLKPLLDLQQTMDVDISVIVQFMSDIYQMKPQKLSYSDFFNECKLKIQKFDNIKKENTRLEALHKTLTIEIANFENELSDLLDLKTKFNYCTQQLIEKESGIKQLEEENQELLHKIEIYTDAISQAKTGIDERDDEIDRLNNLIENLQHTR